MTFGSSFLSMLYSSFMTYHRLCNKSNITGGTRGARTVYLREHLRSPLAFVGFVVLDL